MVARKPNNLDTWKYSILRWSFSVLLFLNVQRSFQMKLLIIAVSTPMASEIISLSPAI